MYSRRFAAFAGIAALALVGCQRQPQQSASQFPAPTRGVFGSAPAMMPRMSYNLTSGLISVDSGAPVYLTVLAVEPRTGEMSVVFPPPGIERPIATDLAISVDLTDEYPVPVHGGGSDLDKINRGRCANPSRAPSGGIPDCVPGYAPMTRPMTPMHSLLALATSEPIVIANDSTDPGKGRGIRRFLPEQWAGEWLIQANASVARSRR